MRKSFKDKQWRLLSLSIWFLSITFYALSLFNWYSPPENPFYEDDLARLLTKNKALARELFKARRDRDNWKDFYHLSEKRSFSGKEREIVKECANRKH